MYTLICSLIRTDTYNALFNFRFVKLNRPQVSTAYNVQVEERKILKDALASIEIFLQTIVVKQMNILGTS